MSKLTDNLDTTIAAAVNAQIQANVLEALSGDEFFKKYVHGVLYGLVEVPDPKSGNSYSKIKVPFIDNAIAGVIRKATQEAVAQAVEEERETIQDEVRKAVKRRSADIAVVMTDELLKSAEQQYRFDVKLYAPKRDY